MREPLATICGLNNHPLGGQGWVLCRLMEYDIVPASGLPEFNRRKSTKWSPIVDALWNLSGDDAIKIPCPDATEAEQRRPCIITAARNYGIRVQTNIVGNDIYVRRKHK